MPQSTASSGLITSDLLKYLSISLYLNPSFLSCSYWWVTISLCKSTIG